MKNNKNIVAVLLPSVIMILLTGRTVLRHIDEPGGWRFIVSLVALLIFTGFFTLVCLRLRQKRLNKE
jgi:hypothetical protein